MTSRSRRGVAAVSMAAVSAFAVTSCGKDAATPAASSAPVSVTTTAVATTSSTVIATSTAPEAVSAFPNPTAAATALFKAWTAKNRAGAGALRLAPVAELDKLFAKPALSGAKQRSCDDGAFGPATCFFGNGQGGVSITLHRAGSGWSITTIDAY